MIVRPFGDTGLVVSALGLGAGAVGAASSDREADDLLSAAVDLGITFLDTAPSYGSSEERIGRWLAAEPSRRARVVLSTKTGYGVAGAVDWTAECVTRGIHEALERMRIDVIDVMHLHSCPRDVLERADQVIEPLERAREAGKIKVVAYSGENDALEWATSSGRFGAIQCSVNLFDQRSLDGSVAVARARGFGVVAKRALGNAPWRFLERPAGDYAERYWERMRAMQLHPCELGWSELALRFATFAPGVSTALVGTRSRGHLEANARAIERGPLPASTYESVRTVFHAHHDASWIGQV